MDTREYGYNQIRVHIHILMGSQIPVYYIRGYSFNYLLRTVTDFTHRYPWTGIFATLIMI